MSTYNLCFYLRNRNLKYTFLQKCASCLELFVLLRLQFDAAWFGLEQFECAGRQIGAAHLLSFLTV